MLGSDASSVTALEATLGTVSRFSLGTLVVVVDGLDAVGLDAVAFGVDAFEVDALDEGALVLFVALVVGSAFVGVEMTVVGGGAVVFEAALDAFVGLVEAASVVGGGAADGLGFVELLGEVLSGVLEGVDALVGEDWLTVL